MLLFDRRRWLVLLKDPQHHLRESIRVFAYFSQCGAQRTRVCLEYRVNASPHCDHLVTVIWHLLAKYKILVVVSPRLRRICNISFLNFVDLFVHVSVFFAQPFGDCGVAVALFTLEFGENRNAF
jgi:hypothetical protein